MSHQFKSIILGLALSVSATQSLVAEPVGEGFSGNFPVVSGKGALTVSGKGYHHRELYDDGEVPTLTARDSSGQLLPDGRYRFQFTSSPKGGPSSARQRDVFKGKASIPTGEASPAPTQLSGVFEVEGGRLTYK